MTTRRDFLSRSATGLVGAVLGGSSIYSLAAKAALASDLGPSEISYNAVPVLQGWTTASETEIKLLRPTSMRYHYRALRPNGEELEVSVLDEFRFLSDSADTIDHLEISGLRLGESYRLLISDDKQQIDEREFSALDLSKTTARIAVLSCMHDTFLLDQKMMWRAVDRTRPDLMIFLGDACYADFGSNGQPPGIWRRHCETRKALDGFRIKKLIPSIAVWDDHDFGVNDGNSTFPFKADALRIFEAMFGSVSRTRHARGPGTSRIVNAFGLRIALMDDRYFRTPNYASNETHWGEEQENFLAENLASATMPTLLCNGDQFYGQYHGQESFEGNQPKAFARFTQYLSTVESPVMFLSGDVHFSEVMGIEARQLGYPTWELTSSSLHSVSFPGMHLFAPNPRRIKAASLHNFQLLTTRTDPSNPTKMDFETRCIDRIGTVFRFSETLRRS